MLFNESFLSFVKNRPSIRLADSYGYKIEIINFSQYTSNRNFKTNIFTDELMNICSSSVNKKYVDDTIIEIYLASRSPSTNPFELAVLKNKDGIHVGMLIIETGECKLAGFEKTPVLRLICARSGEGTTLIYYYVQAMCYAYHKLNKKECRYGLLELADHYDNIRGLCAYDKFGFREDYSILRRNCFGVPESLPMMVDLEKVTYDDLDNVIASGYRIPQVKSPEPLCSKRFIKNKSTENKQNKELEKRYNLYQKLMKDDTSYYDSLLVDGRGDEYTQNILTRLRDSKQESKKVLDTLNESKETIKPKKPKKPKETNKSRKRMSIKEHSISRMNTRSKSRAKNMEDTIQLQRRDRNIRVYTRRKSAIKATAKNNEHKSYRRKGKRRRKRRSKRNKAKRNRKTK